MSFEGMPTIVCVKSQHKHSICCLDIQQVYVPDGTNVPSLGRWRIYSIAVVFMSECTAVHGAAAPCRASFSLVLSSAVLLSC